MSDTYTNQPGESAALEREIERLKVDKKDLLARLQIEMAKNERLRGEIVKSLIKRVELVDAASAREQGAYKTAEEHLNRAEAAEAHCKKLETKNEQNKIALENIEKAWLRGELPLGVRCEPWETTEARCKELEAENSILRGLSQKATIDRGSFAEYAEGTDTIVTSEKTHAALAETEPKEESHEKEESQIVMERGLDGISHYYPEVEPKEPPA